MANHSHSRSALSDIGGKHFPEHKLVPDAPSSLRYKEPRASSSDTAQGSTHQSGGRGSEQSAGEENANEDDDEDSSAVQEDEQEDDEDEPEVTAPSHGYGKGKGKRPAIRVDHADDNESLNDDEETTSRETGLTLGHLPVSHLNGNKKRTFSNVSNTSLLFGDDDASQDTFPRPKVARTLSHTGDSGLLTYKATIDKHANGSENAVESSDEDHNATNAEVEHTTDNDDEDYSGVNLISDDESDVEGMEQQEESFIINNQDDASLFNFQFNDARRLSLDSYGSENVFDFDTMASNAYDAPSGMQDLGFGQFFETAPLPASPEPMAKRKFSDSSNKRVRFEDEVQMSDSSSSTSSELDNSTFPDLFLDQDKIPPSLYQLMETDHDVDDGDFPSSASEQSYWDFGQEEHSNQIATLESDEFDSSSDAGSSGYETDMGDTTDEYDSDDERMGPPQTPKQRSVLHRPSSAPGSRAVSPRRFPRSTTGPLRGIFIHEDNRKAIAVTNRNTKTLTFYRPRATISLRQPLYSAYSSSASTANNSPRTSIQQMNLSDSDVSNEVFSNAFMHSMNTTDIMLTGVFGSAPANTYLFGGDTIGPPEAFYPFVSVGQNGNVMTSDEDEFVDEDDYEDDVNIADFMDFGSDVDATDLEQDDETDVPATPATSMVAINGSTPAQATPFSETPSNRKRNTSDAMLEHFDRAGVTAFRNNQNRFRDIACLPNDADLRASVSRPIRSGRSAETLMSPLRKRSMMPKKRISSPFAGVTKASGRLQSSVINGRRGPRAGTFS